MLKMDKRQVSLSKFMALLLRHKPEKYGLILDEEGYVLVAELVKVVNSHWKGSGKITEGDIALLISYSDKKRFEIKEGKIRAIYGHSPDIAPKYLPIEPPEILYHGTARRFLSDIKKKGLRPMGRSYVHLSTTEEHAHIVGRRKDKFPLILRIRAQEAYLAGIPFFKGSTQVYLSEEIPVGVY